MEKQEDIDIIGQFGVGFYSAFMVSDKVNVVSKAYGSDQAYEWESSGADGYTIKEAEKRGKRYGDHAEPQGYTEDEKYSEYIDTYKMKKV
ncbi:MAG: hypothetical protein V8Q65_00145 [Bacteroidaceae bacterium]